MSIIKKWAQKIGFDVARYRPYNELICHSGFDTLIDIGANEGQFAEEIRAAGYKGNIISIEPVLAAYAKLQNKTNNVPNWTCHNFALGAAEDKLVLNVNADTRLSSFATLGDSGTNLTSTQSVKVH